MKPKSGKNPANEAYFDMNALFQAPIKNPTEKIPEGFYAQGSGVFYRSAYSLHAGSPVADAQEKLLLRAQEVVGSGFGELLSASDVAKLVAEILNEKRAEFFKTLGVEKAVA